MKNSERLLKNIKKLGFVVPDDTYIKRTYAGRHQKAAGAWTAYYKSNSNPLFEIGLLRPVIELLRCPNLECYDSFGLTVDCGCKGTCKRRIEK